MRIILIFLLIVFSYGFDANSTKILASVSKNSKEYNLDLVLAKKIKNLKFKAIKFQINKTSTPFEYIKEFRHLIKIQEDINALPKQIKSIQNKINVLSSSSNSTEKLQSLYYQKYVTILNKKLSYLKNHMVKWENKLFDNIKLLHIDLKKVKQNISYWNNLLVQKKIEYSKLNIDLQKWQLLDKKVDMQITQKYLTINLSKQKEIYNNLLDNQIILWLYNIKIKNKNAFNVDDKIFIYSQKINSKLYNAVKFIIVYFENKKFGSSALIYGTKKEIEIFISKIWIALNTPLFHISSKSVTTIDFLLFFIVLIIGVMIGKYYKKLIYSLRHTKNISYSTATLLANLGYYSILTISFLIALKVIGLDLSSLAIIAGALSVGIGFGLQNIVSNFVSGIIIMFERTIKVGDYIQIDNDTRGEVLDISMRSTVIRTNDNINLIIPNQSFIQNDVINWTLGDDIVRFRVPFGVAYGSDIDEVERIILGALHNNKDLPYVKNKFGDYEIRVVFMSMGDSSLNFELFVWVKGDFARRPRRTRSDFLKEIYKALNKAGITIPFPQTDLHIVDSVPLEINIKQKD